MNTKKIMNSMCNEIMNYAIYHSFTHTHIYALSLSKKYVSTIYIGFVFERSRKISAKLIKIFLIKSS